MVHWWRLQNGRLEPCPAGEGQVLVYVNPDETERRHLVQDLKVDEHTLASVLDPDELARMEFEPEHAAIIMKRPKNYSAADNFLFKVASLGILMFRDRLALGFPAPGSRAAPSTRTRRCSKAGSSRR